MRVILVPLLMLMAAGCTDAGPSDPAPQKPALTAEPTQQGEPMTAPRVATPQPNAFAANAPPLGSANGQNVPAAIADQPKSPTILPLSKILGIVRASVPGEVIDVDLDDDDGLFIYEIEVLTPDGRKIEMKVDAAQGTVLETEED